MRRLRELEHELEMAAENLSGGAGEMESGAADTYRYVDALTFEGGAWKTLEAFNPFKDTRENALRMQGTLRVKWDPYAKSRGVPFTVRCLSFSPVQNRWLTCQEYSR